MSLFTEPRSPAKQPEHVPETIDVEAIQSYCDQFLSQYQSVDAKELPPFLALEVEDTLRERSADAEQGHQSVVIFLQRLLEHIEFARRAQQPDQLNPLLAIGSRLVAEGSDNLFSSLKLDQRFAIFSRTLRTPELQGWKVGIKLSLLDDINLWDQKTIQRLTEFAQEQSAPQALDLIHGCESLLAMASDGDPETVQLRQEQLRTLMQKLGDTSPYPFIRLAVDALLQKLSHLDTFEFIQQQRSNPFLRREDGTIAVAKDVGGQSDNRGVIVNIADRPLRDVLQDSRILPFHHVLDIESAEMVLQQMHRPYMRQHLEQQFGIQLSEMTLRSQLQFLGFLVQHDEGTIERMQGVLQGSRLDAETKQAYTETFFAAAENSSIADDLLNTAEQLPPDVLKIMCNGYQELTQHVADIEQFIQQQFRTEGEHTIDTRAVVQGIVRRANRELRQAIKEPDADRIVKRWKRINGDTIAYASFCKELFSNSKEDIQFEDLRDTTYETYSSGSLPAEYRQFMYDIAAQNYAGNQQAIERFSKLFLAADAEATPVTNDEWHVVKRGEEILGFLRIQEDSSQRKFISAFNINKAYQESGIAEKMLTQVIRNLKEQHTVAAQFLPRAESGFLLIRKIGFIGKEFLLPEQANTPQGLINIEIQKERPAYTLDSKSVDELAADVIPLESITTAGADNALWNQPTVVVRFDLQQTQPNDLTAVLHLLLNDHKYELVRYECIDPKQQCTERLIGFEKIM